MFCLEGSCKSKSKYFGCCDIHADRQIQENLKGVKLIKISKANDGQHKYVATFEKNGRENHTSFGLAGFNDFILWQKEGKQHALERRDLYWQRHSKDLKTLDPTAAGYLSLFILWNKPTLEASIADYKRRFGL